MALQMDQQYAFNPPIFATLCKGISKAKHVACSLVDFQIRHEN